MLLSAKVQYALLSDFGPMDAIQTLSLESRRFLPRLTNEINDTMNYDVWLIRHGETEWTVSRRHTGLTNLPLTLAGEKQARRLRCTLEPSKFVRVFCSTLRRAVRTCELAGFGSVAEVDSNLVEWNYGDYEGKRRPEILAARFDWIIFRDGCPNGETPEDVAARADLFLSRIRQANGNVAVFSSGHFLRVLIARWLGLDPCAGRYFKVGTASVSVLGYDHNSATEPVIRSLNERRE
jgi:broad specificity phosphatase PhoE